MMQPSTVVRKMNVTNILDKKIAIPDRPDQGKLYLAIVGLVGINNNWVTFTV